MWGKDMAEPITLQELKDASEDALTLKNFMYKPSDVLINRRLAPDIQSLQYYLDFLQGLELVYSQQSGSVVVNGVETKTVTQAVQDAINSNASVFKGDKGDSGTIENFTVSTGAAGTAAQVTLGGTPQAREIALTVPRGDKGETGNLPNIYSTTTLDAPNVSIASDGTFKRSNDPLNAASRKVGTAAGNLVERDANGYPKNNNALGVGQTWQDVSASRLSGVTYTNTTGRPIAVSFTRFITAGGTASTLTLNGIVTQSRGHTGSSAGSGHGYDFVVPNQATYSITTGGGTTSWLELR